MSEEPRTQTWNEQLADWFISNGKSIRETAIAIGIPRTTLTNYVKGETKNLESVSPERLGVLYELTSLECFKYESPRIDMPEPARKASYRQDPAIAEGRTLARDARKQKAGIDNSVEQASSDLTGTQKLESGLLRSQRYQPTAQQRTDAVMELFDILSEEIDYFRTAPDKEKDILAKRLQGEPESFSYVSQMINIIHSGKKINDWMLMSQPPSRIRRLRRRK